MIRCCFSIIMDPLNPIGRSFEKICSQKEISYKGKDLINKVKCFTENDNHKVWSDRKLLFWFAKDQRWMEIKSRTKFSHPKYHSAKHGVICCPDHSQNSCHKQLELLILSVQECRFTSWIFRSRSFFQFLMQCQMKAEICLRRFCQIRWSENWTWFYCFVGIKLIPTWRHEIF